MAKTALLVVDVQLGMFMRKEYDGVAVYQEEVLLENLQSLIAKARTEQIHIIYIQHVFKDVPFMEKGQPFWNVHPSITPVEDDFIIEKHHADAFFDTDLHETLSRLDVSKLIITGMQTEYCVDTTCRRAHSLRYETVLVSDGHSTFDSDSLKAPQIIAHHNEVLSSQFAVLKATSEVTFK